MPTIIKASAKRIGTIESINISRVGDFWSRLLEMNCYPAGDEGLSGPCDEGQMNRRPDAFHLRASVLIVPLLLESYCCEATPSEQRAARCVAAAEPTPSGGFRGTRSHCTQRACMEVPTSNVQKRTRLAGGLGSEGPGACLERRGGALWCTREPVRLQDSVLPGPVSALTLRNR